MTEKSSRTTLWVPNFHKRPSSPHRLFLTHQRRTPGVHGCPADCPRMACLQYTVEVELCRFVKIAHRCSTHIPCSQPCDSYHSLHPKVLPVSTKQQNSMLRQQCCDRLNTDSWKLSEYYQVCQKAIHKINFLCTVMSWGWICADWYK